MGWWEGQLPSECSNSPDLGPRGNHEGDLGRRLEEAAGGAQEGCGVQRPWRLVTTFSPARAPVSGCAWVAALRLSRGCWAAGLRAECRAEVWL